MKVNQKGLNPSRVEVAQKFLKKGRVDLETGKIFDKRGKEITTRHQMKQNKDYIRVSVGRDYILGHQLVYYLGYGYIPDLIHHRNEKKYDNRLENLEASTFRENVVNTSRVRNAKCYTFSNNRYMIKKYGVYVASVLTLEEAEKHRWALNAFTTKEEVLAYKEGLK